MKLIDMTETEYPNVGRTGIDKLLIKFSKLI